MEKRKGLNMEFIKENCKTVGDLQRLAEEHNTFSKDFFHRERSKVSSPPSALLSGNFAEDFVNGL